MDVDLVVQADGATPRHEEGAQQQLPPPPQQQQQQPQLQCIILKNMFDPKTMTGEEWWLEIGEEVRDECSKHGEVLHLHVDPDSQGFV